PLFGGKAWPLPVRHRFHQRAALRALGGQVAVAVLLDAPRRTRAGMGGQRLGPTLGKRLPGRRPAGRAQRRVAGGGGGWVQAGVVAGRMPRILSLLPSAGALRLVCAAPIVRMPMPALQTRNRLSEVRYEIRGELARRARELEAQGRS